MNWIKQLNAAIDYIENNLDAEISYGEIARIANCSIYNFQRMFSYIADKTLAEYIRSRRLTMAAFDVLRSNDRLIDIALKYGYESQDSFTRAFKAFHGIVPSAVRSETVQLKSCPKLSFQISVKGENHMKYQIEQWPAFKVAGFAHRIKTDEAFEIVPGLWDAAWKNGEIDRLYALFQSTDYRPSGFLGMAIGGQQGDCEDMDYFLGVTNHVDVENCTHAPALNGMDEIPIKAATWVVLEANGELPDAVQSIHKQFYSEWLPNSGYQLDDLPIIECYMQNNRQEVWIAVKNMAQEKRPS